MLPTVRSETRSWPESATSRNYQVNDAAVRCASAPALPRRPFTIGGLAGAVWTAR
jgi:hypothetical protein